MVDRRPAPRGLQAAPVRRRDPAVHDPAPAGLHPRAEPRRRTHAGGQARGWRAKNREIDAAGRDTIVKLYHAFSETEHSKTFEIAEFGYWTITVVERPLLGDDGKPALDSTGKPKPDSKLRDTENVPFTYAGGIDAYVAAEVLPYVRDARIDPKKTKVGYEIPFTRHFYRYVPPRPLAEIDADLEAQVAKIMLLLKGIKG